MGNPRHVLGRAAEEVVAGWLTAAGWEILDRRIRAGRGGEVDLIALDPRRVLVAVEVRSRRSDRTGAAATTVGHRRIHRLEGTLVAYASARTEPHRGLRVDLVTVERVAGSPGSWVVRRIPGVGGR